MSAYLETLASYVPRFIVNRFAAHPAPMTEPVAERFPAALLFADITGFTALTERLAKRGPAGVEQVSALLNDYLGRLIDLMCAHGGDVVKFAGDALLALWPATDDTLSRVTHRATQCGLIAQKTLHNYEPFEDVRLSLRISIGTGDMLAVHLGGVHDRWEFIVAGEPLAQLSTVKQQALPGDALLSPQAWALVQDYCIGHPLPSGDVLLGAVRTPPPPFEPPATRALPIEAETALRAYIPNSALARLAASQTGWMAELRRVTVVFLNLPDHNYRTSLDQAQDMMRAMQTTLHRYEGSINKLSVDDQGVTLVAALGLPPLAHEDDAVRGVQVALALQSAARDRGLRSAIGVTTGQIFCGSVGNARRREYTLVGDVVNLATRLMQNAPDDIFCDEETYRATATRVAYEPLAAIKVKGKAEPVAIYRPHLGLRISDRGLSQVESTVRRPFDSAQGRLEAAFRHPKSKIEMVGRAAERALLLDRVQTVLRGGAGGIVVVEGDPGIGKSRLVEDLLDRAQALGVPGLMGAGDAIEKSTPYHAWRPVFGQLFGVDSTGDPAVLARLEPDPNLLRLAPLLNMVLPLELPDNDLTEQMAGEVRADNTRRLLLSLLARMPGESAAAARQPRLLILEDAHWLDSASWALALQVSREIPSTLIVIAARPMDDPLPMEYSQLLHAPGTERLVLEPLPADDSLALVCRRLGVAALPDAVRTLILEKAEGHPFFSEELAYALRDAGLILIEDSDCRIAPDAGDLRALNLPNTVQGVITGRIDRLTPAQQLTLKVASVIGRVFAFKILRGIHPIESDRPRLPDYLDALQRLDITPLESPEPELSYIFKHIITREVAYNLMLFSQRRQLHRAAAEWYEHAQPGELTSLSPLLAHHWRLAEDTPKALNYLEKAGEQALRGGAYREAVGFFSEAIALDERRRTLSPSRRGQVTEDEGRRTADEGRKAIARSPSSDLRRARWERQLGEAYLGLGELPDSRRHLEASVSLLGWPVPGRRGQVARTLLGQVLRQVLHRRLPGRFVGRDEEQGEALLEAARAYERLSEIYYFAQERPLLLNAAFHALNLSERAGPSPELARAYANMCVVAGLVRLHGLAQAYARQALETAERFNHLPTRARALSRTGLYGLGIGRWSQAGAALEQAVEIADSLGDQRQGGESLAVRAQVAYFQGEFDRSRQLFADVYARAHRHGNIQYQAWGLWGQSHSLVRLGRFDEAASSLNTALELIAQMVDRGSEIIARGLLAVAYLHQGQPELARSTADAVARLYAGSSRRFSVADLEGHAGAAEVFLTLWETGGHQPLPEQQALAASAGAALEAARHYARIYPIGEPRAWLLQGLYDWLAGRSRQARRAWQRSLSAAERLEMPYEQGRAHYEIGRHLDTRDPARAQHLTRACEIFDQIGATYDAAKTQKI